MFDKKIKFYLPDLFTNFYLNRFFISLQSKYPQYYNENITISGVYGSFPKMLWGIKLSKKLCNLKNIDLIINFYNQNNISINFLFYNKYLKNEHLFDQYSNLILKKAHNLLNTVILYSDDLALYIKNKYPKYKIIKITTPAELNKKNILIESRYNNTFDLKNIKYPKDTYVLLNPICNSDCKYYENHREYLSYSQLNFIQKNRFYICPLKTDLMFYDLFTNKNFISNDILKEYIKANLQNFLIDSEIMIKDTNVFYNKHDIIESLIYYLIKEQYQAKVRNQITKNYIYMSQKKQVKK